MQGGSGGRTEEEFREQHANATFLNLCSMLTEIQKAIKEVEQEVVIVGTVVNRALHRIHRNQTRFSARNRSILHSVDPWASPVL